MDNLVETLQTQREELLAAHAAASDRDTARQIVQQLKSVSEELELVAAAASSSPQSALSPDLYASYLLVVLLSKNLNDARFLWKRIPIEIKQISEELRNAWEVGKALWQRNLAAAYAAMDYDWSPSLQGLVEALKTSTREDAAELLSLAYSTVSVSDAALALGFARHEDAVQYCSSLGWEVSAPNRLILPKPLANTRRGRSTVVDLDQLDTLSKTVLHLEQNTVLKLPQLFAYLVWLPHLDTLPMEKRKARRKIKELKAASDAESTVSTRSSNSSNSSTSWKQKQRRLKAQRTSHDSGNDNLKHHHKEDTNAQFKSLEGRLGAILETTEAQVVMILLIALDIGCTAVGIHLHNQQQLNTRSTPADASTEVVTSLLVRVITRLVESFTGFTLFLFLIELAVLLAAFRHKFFAHAGYVLDLTVVSVSLAVELYAQTKVARLLGILRVWRVLRLVRRIVDQERAAHDTTRQLLEQEQLKLLHVRMQKDAAHESLKREYESRAGLEQLLRSYKDEIVTLKEALQIAAQAVAAATMNESPPFEYSEAGDAENSFGSYPAVDEYSKEYYRHEVAAVHPTELHLEQWQEDHQEARSENAFEDAVDE